MKSEYSESCIFFNDRMDFMPSVSSVYKKMYCMGISQNCTRYMIARKLGTESIPSNLFPIPHLRAGSLLRRGKLTG